MPAKPSQPHPLRALVVMDPIDEIKPVKDTTLAMLLAAQKRGWELWYAEQHDLWLRDGVAHGRVRPISVRNDLHDWFTLDTAHTRPLADFNAILMRKDPPFDMEYVYSTYLLELAEKRGARVFNRPRAIRDWNEKMGAMRFPQFAPPTLVTRGDAQVREFLAEHRDVILKPLDGMGGSSIFRVRENDPNVSVIIETLTDHGGRTIMAQRFIPEIRDGDKRVLLIAGKAVPHALARIPKAGETRGNLAAGATGVARELTRRDREIAEAVGPALQKEGLLLVGLDVIGDWLTEVNVTSPTCVRELDAQFGLNIAGTLFDAIEASLAQ
jgi:glutathione synthase